VRRAIVCLALSLLAVLTACDPLATPEGPAPLRYRDDVFTTLEEITGTNAITFGSAVDQTGTRVTLKLDLYRPAGDTVTSRPAIVWVHGGSFCCGSRTSPEIVEEARYFARKGYVSVSIDYRLADGGCTGAAPLQVCLTAIAHAREDAETAVRFLRANAATYGIDPTRIAIGGTSAGAITALNVGYSNENPSPGDHQGFASSVRAAQSLSGAELVSGNTINAGDAPALLFHGTNDGAVPYAWAQSTVDRAEDAGLLALLRTWEGEGHVPYAAHRTQILTETRNFFYSQMDLAHAAR
jgi:para-nitrobenzyl esterase